MDPELERLIEKLLALPPEARAALAGSLLDSLDGSVEEGAEAAWESEIALRIAELDAGEVKAIPWSEVRRTLLNS